MNKHFDAADFHGRSHRLTEAELLRGIYVCAIIVVPLVVYWWTGVM